MKKVYLNCKGACGVETVDEFTQGVDAPSVRREFKKYVKEAISEYHIANREFKKYVKEAISEYHIANIAVYLSSRPCKGWKS